MTRTDKGGFDPLDSWSETVGLSREKLTLVPPAFGGDWDKTVRRELSDVRKVFEYTISSDLVSAYMDIQKWDGGQTLAENRSAASAFCQQLILSTTQIECLQCDMHVSVRQSQEEGELQECREGAC